MFATVVTTITSRVEILEDGDFGEIKHELDVDGGALPYEVVLSLALGGARTAEAALVEALNGEG